MAQALDELGGELEEEVEEGAARLTMTVPSRNLGKAIDLLGDVLAKPRFDEVEWGRIRERRVAEILRRRDEPREVADDVFKRALYGEGPYGTATLGKKEVVQRLGVADLRSFYAAHYGPKTVSFLVVGDARVDEVAGKVERALSGWSSTAALPPRPAVEVLGGGKVILVDRPGAPQSEVRAGHVGLSFDSPNVAAGVLLDMVLGGSFTSRLVQNLREKHGYTYGAHSVFHLWQSPGPFEISSAVRTDVTGPAVGEIVAELKGMLAELSEADVKKGRSLVESTIIERFSDGQGTLLELWQLLQHQVPLDFWGRLPAALAALDGGVLHRLAPSLFHPESLVLVVVGDRRRIEPQLRALPFVKEIELRDADGEIVH
jgi:zinc protease